MEHVSEAFSSNVTAGMGEEMKDFGTFDGHIRPGVVCIFYGLLWTYNNLFHYHAARKEALLNGRDEKKLNYKSELFSKHKDGSFWALAEPYLVLFVSLVGFFAEVYITIFGGHPATLALHHILMYVFYSILAVCEILRYRKHEVPPSAAHVIFLVANVAEGYLFLIHRHDGLSGKMHKSIAFLNFITSLCVACEIVYRRSIVAVLGRTLSFLAQGIYFCFMAVILYPISIIPKWEAEEHIKMDVASSLVVVDFALVILLGAIMNIIVSYRVKKLNLAAINCSAAFSNHIVYSSVSSEDCGKACNTDLEGSN